MNSFVLEKTLKLRLIALSSTQDLNILNYDFKFTLLTVMESESSSDLEKAQQTQNISYNTIITFLTDLVDNSIIVVGNKASDMDAISGFTNNLIVVPDLSELSLIATLHSKLNAITAEATTVDKITLRDVDSDLSYEYILLDDHYDELPSAEEWSNELSYWPGCWWNRVDITTSDRIAENKKEHTKWLKIKKEHNIDEINKQWLHSIEQAFACTSLGEGQVIEVDFEANEPKPAWRPVFVD